MEHLHNPVYRADTAEDSGAADAGALTQRPDGFVNLERQFPGGGND